MLFRRQPPHLLEAEIPRLRRYARALCRDATQADDLVQECLAKALAAWGQRREDGALRPWLFAILHNTWANGLRREYGRPDAVALDETVDEPAISGGQIERLELLDLQTALDRLSEEQRSLLLLVAVEGLSYEEAARVQGVALGTVMSRLTRARDRLHRLLHGESDADPNRPRQKGPSLRRVK